MEKMMRFRLRSYHLCIPLSNSQTAATAMTTARGALPLLFFFFPPFPLLLNAGVVGANPLLDYLQPNPQRRTLIAPVCFAARR